MNDCCSLPVQKGESYLSRCPRCGEKGQPVKALTIRSLTREDWPGYPAIIDGYFCTNPHDPTVYYFPGREQVINKEDLKIRVGLKEQQEPIYVCYCFRHTRAEIEADFLRNNSSTIEADIRRKVKAGKCSCEIQNPSGRCCLGDVRKVAKAAAEQHPALV